MVTSFEFPALFGIYHDYESIVSNANANRKKIFIRTKAKSSIHISRRSKRQKMKIYGRRIDNGKTEVYVKHWMGCMTWMEYDRLTADDKARADRLQIEIEKPCVIDGSDLVDSPRGDDQYEVRAILAWDPNADKFLIEYYGPWTAFWTWEPRVPNLSYILSHKAADLAFFIEHN